jgi:hypothetical protein
LVFRPRWGRKTKHLLGFQVADGDLKPWQFFIMRIAALFYRIVFSQELRIAMDSAVVVASCRAATALNTLLIVG